MPCEKSSHTHTWPTEGVLTIERCERYCDFCEFPENGHRWKFAWFLRRHVQKVHIESGEYSNLTLTTGWSHAPEGNAGKGSPSRPKRRRNAQKLKLNERLAQNANAVEQTVVAQPFTEQSFDFQPATEQSFALQPATEQSFTLQPDMEESFNFQFQQAMDQTFNSDPAIDQTFSAGNTDESPSSVMNSSYFGSDFSSSDISELFPGANGTVTNDDFSGNQTDLSDYQSDNNAENIEIARQFDNFSFNDNVNANYNQVANADDDEFIVIDDDEDEDDEDDAEEPVLTEEDFIAIHNAVVSEQNPVSYSNQFNTAQYNTGSVSPGTVSLQQLTSNNPVVAQQSYNDTAFENGLVVNTSAADNDFYGSPGTQSGEDPSTPLSQLNEEPYDGPEWDEWDEQLFEQNLSTHFEDNMFDDY